VVAAFAGWFLLGEALGPRQLLGAALVLSGVAWPALRRIRVVATPGNAPAKP
jgi:drug/metabolite transporter (DMT)-like permease